MSKCRLCFVYYINFMIPRFASRVGLVAFGYAPWEDSHGATRDKIGNLQLRYPVRNRPLVFGSGSSSGNWFRNTCTDPVRVSSCQLGRSVRRAQSSSWSVRVPDWDPELRTEAKKAGIYIYIYLHLPTLPNVRPFACVFCWWKGRRSRYEHLFSWFTRIHWVALIHRSAPATLAPAPGAAINRLAPNLLQAPPPARHPLWNMASLKKNGTSLNSSNNILSIVLCCPNSDTEKTEAQVVSWIFWPTPHPCSFS